ncbi:hypothetical protein V6N13_075353 [Hibiscus sabdariffa]
MARNVPVPSMQGLVVLYMIVVMHGLLVLDAKLAISALSDTNVRNGYPVLLTNILSLCQRSWVIEFLWVPHAANKVVDQLLKQNLLTHFDIIHLDDPSAYLQSFLDQDYNSPYGLAVA